MVNYDKIIQVFIFYKVNYILFLSPYVLIIFLEFKINYSKIYILVYNFFFHFIIFYFYIFYNIANYSNKPLKNVLHFEFLNILRKEKKIPKK